ncbi:MAG: phage tail protein [Erythrobacter sp.]|nr:phage tail protein [Erythrobacter sp.]
MAFNFCPRNWAAANGQLLAIASNSALFSLLGTTYGGDGRTTFALPDMRSRVPIGDGQGPGLSNYVEGQRAGQETVTLTINELPSHTHAATVHVANINGNTRAATNANFATATGLTYDSAGTNGTADVMNAGTVVNGNTGGNQAHENRMPYVALNWCIALFGIFPSRN